MRFCVRPHKHIQLVAASRITKSLDLGMTLRARVFVCSNMAFSGDFTPVLAKHTKSFNLVDTLSVGVDRIQRNFEPLQRQVETWRKTQITDETAKLIFYSAFIDGKLEAPRACCPRSIGCISSRNTRNSRPGPCGACRTPSPAPSRSSILCRSLRRRPSWAAFSHNCRHNHLGSVQSGHHAERVLRLFEYQGRLRDEDPFRTCR